MAVTHITVRTTTSQGIPIVPCDEHNDCAGCYSKEGRFSQWRFVHVRFDIKRMEASIDESLAIDGSATVTALGEIFTSAFFCLYHVVVRRRIGMSDVKLT